MTDLWATESPVPEDGATTLTEFLLARIAEDEAAARAAIAQEPRTRKLWDGREVTEVDEGVWQAGPEDEYDECRVTGTFMTIYDEGGHSPQQAQHIARHDPARVLARCEADRRIVELHHETWDDDKGGALVSFGCVECSGEGYWPCTTLQLLALPYADHPDFRDEWRP